MSPALLLLTLTVCVSGGGGGHDPSADVSPEWISLLQQSLPVADRAELEKEKFPETACRISLPID